MLGLKTNKKVKEFKFVGKQESVNVIKFTDDLEFYRNMLIAYHKGEVHLTDEGLEFIFQNLEQSENVEDTEMSYIV